MGMMMLVSWLLMLDNVELPDFYNLFLNDKTAAAIMAVVANVQLIKNIIKVQGFLAVVLTFVASLIYGLVQYGLGGDGAWYGLFVGSLSALAFFWTKNIGKVVDKIIDAYKSRPDLIEPTKAITLKNILLEIIKLIRFFFVRK